MLFISASCFSQNLAAYVDYRNYFYSFDAGSFTQLDHQRPRSFKVGGNAIAFISNADNFKVFYKGFTFDVTEGAFVRNYAVNDILVAYMQSNQLSVFEKGNIKTLCMWALTYDVGDSILIYLDDISRTFKAYYQGDNYQLDDLLAGGSTIKSYRIGGNLVAFINRNYVMRVFYQGAVFDLQNTDNEEIQYEAGMDLVGYVDQLNNTFNVFYRGHIYELEKSPPQSFQVGNGMLAYVDIEGNFKRFADGKTKTITSFAPQAYNVTDSMITWNDNNGNFSIFYNGKSYTLENYVPKEIKADNNMVAYIDQLNRLKLFKWGETKIVTYDEVNSFELNKNVLRYSIYNNDVKFYFNGKTY